MCLARRAFFFFEKKESKKTFSEQNPLKNFVLVIRRKKNDLSIEILQRIAQKLLGTNTILMNFFKLLIINVLSVFNFYKQLIIIILNLLRNFKS